MQNYLFLRWQPQKEQKTDNLNHNTRNSNNKVADFAKIQDMSLKIVRNKEQGRQSEKQTTKKPNGKTFPPCPPCQRTNHTGDISWNGQTRLIDLKGTQVKIRTVQQTKVKNRERPHEMPRHPFLRTL